MDNTDIKILVERLTRLEEGDIGRKIGSAIGGIFGKDAGDRLGQIGSNIGDIFDPATKTMITPKPDTIKSAPGSDKSGPPGAATPGTDKSWSVTAAPNASATADQKFFTKNPDGTTSEVTPPPGGFRGKGPTNDKGQEMDKYGNSPGDYTKQDIFAVSAGYGGKPSVGGLEAEIQGVPVLK